MILILSLHHRVVWWVWIPQGSTWPSSTFKTYWNNTLRALPALGTLCEKGRWSEAKAVLIPHLCRAATTASSISAHGGKSAQNRPLQNGKPLGKPTSLRRDLKQSAVGVWRTLGLWVWCIQSCPHKRHETIFANPRNQWNLYDSICKSTGLLMPIHGTGARGGWSFGWPGAVNVAWSPLGLHLGCARQRSAYVKHTHTIKAIWIVARCT